LPRRLEIMPKSWKPKKAIPAIASNPYQTDTPEWHESTHEQPSSIQTDLSDRSLHDTPGGTHQEISAVIHRL
jgi:hypothetical protein